MKKDLDYFKKELNKILDRRLEELEGTTVEKSLANFAFAEIVKAIGSGHLVAKKVMKRNPKTGKVYQSTVWVNPDKQNGLKKYREQDTRGAKIAIGKLKKQIEKCGSPEELMQIVLRNKGRFSDENGKPLPIVQELRKYIDEKNSGFDKKTVDVKKENKKTVLSPKQEENFKKINFENSVLQLKKLFEEYKNNLTDEEKKFVKDKIKNCVARFETVLNEQTKKEYKGSFYVHIKRTLTNGEKYIATILASMGMEVFLIDEPSTGGKKVDAIVNGVPVDFKDVGLGNNAIKDNYQKGMEKENCKGIIMRIEDSIKYLVKDKDGKKVEKPLNEAVRSWTKQKNNGILAIWVDNLDDFKFFDMQKIRSDNESRSVAGRPSQNSKQPNTNIAQDSTVVNEKLAKDTCKSIAELKDYASKKYGIDVEQTDKDMDFSKILDSFNEVEKSVKKYPGLEKHILHLRYSKPGKSWNGLYVHGDKTLYVGNRKEIEKSSTISRPLVRSTSVKEVTIHEIGHAIVEMIRETESLKNKFTDMKNDEKAFEDYFYNSKTLKMQDIRKKYGTYENFKKEGNVKPDWAKYSSYEARKLVFQNEQVEKILNDITKNIVNRAFEKLGVKGKRKQFKINSTNAFEGEKQVIDKDPFFSKIADVSRYALTDDNECIAECFLDYSKNGDNAQPLSKAVYEVLQEALNTNMKKSIRIVVKESFADKYFNRAAALQKSLKAETGGMSYTDFVKSIGENFDFETMRKVCII